jgi:uncharacterized protein involved in exopolysaccharide biosynthesis
MAGLMTVLAVSMIWSLKQTRIYRATVLLQIDADKGKSADSRNEPASEDAQITQVRILSAKPLARLVIEELNLENNPEFASGVDDYLAHLDITPDGSSQLIQVSFESKDPELAARVANAHAKHFVEQSMKDKWEATHRVTEFLEHQLAGLKSKLEQSEENLRAYARENRITVKEDGNDATVQKLVTLEKEYAAAKVDRIKKQSDYQLAQSDNPDVLEQMNSAPVASLRAKLGELKRQESGLALTETPEHPARKSLRSQISETEESLRRETSRIRGGIEASYAAAALREDHIAKTIEQEGKLMNGSDDQMVHYEILKREVDSNKEMYDGLLNHIREAGVSAGVQSANIRIVEPAEVPVTPAKPRAIINMLVAFILSLVVGAVAAILHEATVISRRALG